mmetsp:Transcript_24106/g.60362  ORF Transcript_24106/g.60362 Transcript_24106/m.60362 type:complete len:251 (-) Transcript_24106:879-1631(-)
MHGVALHTLNRGRGEGRVHLLLLLRCGALATRRHDAQHQAHHAANSCDACHRQNLPHRRDRQDVHFQTIGIVHAHHSGARAVPVVGTAQLHAGVRIELRVHDDAVDARGEGEAVGEGGCHNEDHNCAKRNRAQEEEGRCNEGHPSQHEQDGEAKGDDARTQCHGLQHLQCNKVRLRCVTQVNVIGIYGEAVMKKRRIHLEDFPLGDLGCSANEGGGGGGGELGHASPAVAIKCRAALVTPSAFDSLQWSR